jgi:hypothetical protein
MDRNEQIQSASDTYLCGDKSYTAVYEEKAFTAGAEWADNHPNWVDLEDVWPERDRVVLVYSKSFGAATEGVYFKLNNHGLPAFYSYRLDEYLSDVTHWMPLPTPPIG